MRIYLVRHGETEANIKKVTQGHTDSPLTPLGLEQIERLSRRLSSVPLQQCYASDLGRAKETALAIMQSHPEVPVHFTPLLREQDVGVYDGKPYKQLMKAQRAFEDFFLRFTPKGGEASDAWYRRISGFYEELVKKHPDERVLVVSHGGSLAVMLMYVLTVLGTKDNFYDLQMANAALTILNGNNGSLDLIVHNCTKHLEQQAL